MITKKQFDIMRVFKDNLFSELTFSQIKEKAKQKSNSVVQKALADFEADRLLRIRQVGNVKLYSLDLNNAFNYVYLDAVNISERQGKQFPSDIVSALQSRLLKETEFFILAVFGSHANNKATASSDLDVAVIVESENTKKKIIPLLETVKRREVKSIDYHIFTRQELAEMLLSENENLGRQIVKNSRIVYGFEQYIRILQGTSHGR